MKNSLLISKSTDPSGEPLIRAGLLDSQRKVLSFFLDGPSKKRGGIYLGRIKHINLHQKTAFIDLGIPGEALALLPSIAKSGLHEGHMIVCQVTREGVTPGFGLHPKGPRVTQDIALASPYCVYLPKSSGLKISRRMNEKIISLQIQAKLKSELLTDGMIVKSAPTPYSEEFLLHTLLILRAQYQEIHQKLLAHNAPSLIAPGPTFIEDLLNIHASLLSDIYVDDTALLNEVMFYLEKWMFHMPRIHRHPITSPTPLFETFDVQEIWENLLDPVIPLSSGGSLILEKTEACWTIDVNAGGSHLSTEPLNQEAAEEIIRQIFLKNIAGTIVVDFIPLRTLEARTRLMQKLKHLARNDSRQLEVLSLSSTGLCEIVREKREASIIEILKKPAKSF